MVFDGEAAAVAKVEAAWRRMFKREIGRDCTPPGVAALPPVTDPDVRPTSGERMPATRPGPRPREGRRFLLNRADVAPTPTAAAQPGQVWVNLTSGVYHLPGTRYYGKTANGRYMSEQDALKAGYRKAGSE